MDASADGTPYLSTVRGQVMEPSQGSRNLPKRPEQFTPEARHIETA